MGDDDTRRRPRPAPILPEGEAKKRRTHRRLPKKQEKKVAESIGGRKQPGSGAFAHAKGDARRDRDAYLDFPLLVECKRTSHKKSIRVETKWLKKVSREALEENSHPALHLQFDESEMPPMVEADWVAVPLSTLRAMLEALGEDPQV